MAPERIAEAAADVDWSVAALILTPGRVSRSPAGAGLAGAAAVLVWFAVGALVCAAISGLALVVPVWASALIVTAVLLIVAGVFGLVAKKQATEAAPMMPEQAVAGVHEDLEAVKAGVRR